MLEKQTYYNILKYLNSMLKKALVRLNDENLRSRRFLNPSSYNKVNQEVQKRLVEDHLSFLYSECKDLIINETKHDLRNMYKLLKPFSNGLSVMVEEVQNHIARIGLEAVSGLKGDNVRNMIKQ